jgi:dTDP-4-dehydrorhamnose reductase
MSAPLRCIVTGSNGLVGARLSRLLAARGHEVLGLSRGSRRVDGGFSYRDCDLTDAAAVHSTVKAFRPDVVFNPAAATDVDGCERDKAMAWAVNVEAVASLGRACAEQGTHLVHVSTDYVFDGESGPYDEAAAPNPRGAYATSKWLGEWAARYSVPNATIARTAVVYGWPAAGRPNFGSWLLSSLAAGKTVQLFEDQFVSPSLADNVAEMLVELGERRVGGIFHAAGAEVVDRLTFGRALCERFGFDPALIRGSRLADAKLLSPRPRHSGLRVDKAQGVLAYGPLGLGPALERLYKAFRAGPTA